MSRRWNRIRIAFILALLEMSNEGSFAAASEPQDELKSAIVLSFLRYTEWPSADVIPGPITVGVLGRPAFFQILQRALDGKSVDNRPIRTLELTAVIDPHCCQVIYLASEKSPEGKQALLQSPAAHTLTIGEADRFLEAGGAIRLLTIDGHMSFEVNLEVVERSGVVISSRLLRYGEIKGKARQ